jgi:hypothetical protein
MGAGGQPPLIEHPLLRHRLGFGNPRRALRRFLPAVVGTLVLSGFLAEYSRLLPARLRLSEFIGLASIPFFVGYGLATLVSLQRFWASDWPLVLETTPLPRWQHGSALLLSSVAPWLVAIVVLMLTLPDSSRLAEPLPWHSQLCLIVLTGSVFVLFASLIFVVGMHQRTVQRFFYVVPLTVAGALGLYGMAAVIENVAPWGWWAVGLELLLAWPYAALAVVVLDGSMGAMQCGWQRRVEGLVEGSERPKGADGRRFYV